MQVILTQDVKGLGARGETVKVADGYARNYLIPRGLAVEASEGNLRQLRAVRAEQERLAARRQKEAEEMAARLEGTVLRLRAKAGEGGRLFGSITAGDVAGALAQQGIKVEKRQVELSGPIKQLGTHTVTVRLAGGRPVVVQVMVEAAEE